MLLIYGVVLQVPASAVAPKKPMQMIAQARITEQNVVLFIDFMVSSLLFSLSEIRQEYGCQW
jgi:hypothetical protein